MNTENVCGEMIKAKRGFRCILQAIQALGQRALTAAASAGTEAIAVITGTTTDITQTPKAKSENRETSINVMYCRGANYRAKSQQ